jgi:hypothetical protein
MIATTGDLHEFDLVRFDCGHGHLAGLVAEGFEACFSELAIGIAAPTADASLGEENAGVRPAQRDV